MRSATKAKLKEAMDWCDENDKSTEFMIAYMGDVAGVGHDTVMKYLTTDGGFKQSIDNTFPTKKETKKNDGREYRDTDLDDPNMGDQ